MSIETRTNLENLAKHYNLTASAVVDMLIERETRAIEQRKEDENVR
jgi:Mor family transcriptional regulator